MIDLDDLPIDVSLYISNFRDFMNASWSYLHKFMTKKDWDEDPYFTEDWLQVNWELLIERRLLLKKDSLTEIFFTFNNLPERKPSFIIEAKPKSLKNIFELKKNTQIQVNNKLYFNGFCTDKNGRRGLYPPFEFVILIDRKNNFYITLLENVQFYLDELKEDSNINKIE